MKELAAVGIPVAVTCRVLKLSRQPYYRWLASPVTAAELAQAYRANALFNAHQDDPEFGYRFLVDEARDAGEVMCERSAWRICRDNGWWSVFGKKRGKNGKKPGGLTPFRRSSRYESRPVARGRGQGDWSDHDEQQEASHPRAGRP